MGRAEQTWSLNGTQRTPAAEGKVEVAAKAKDGTRAIEVEVKRLAKPEAVFPETSTYVVWLKPEGGRPESLGVLKLDKDLDGKLKAKTPYKVFDIVVTAEASPDAMAPSVNNEVFSQRIYIPS
jgi:hypothetical protein